MGVINDSKYKAFKISLNNIEHAYELYAVQKNIKPGTEINIEDLPLDAKNLKGKVFLNSEGKIELKEVTDGTYSAEGTLDDLSVLKGTVEDLLANRLEINVNVNNTARNIIITVETIDGVPTSYSYQILEPEEYKKEINNTDKNTYTFDKLKIDTEYKIKVIVKNKAGLTKEITRTVRTLNINSINIEFSPTDRYVKEGTITITYPDFESGLVSKYSWDDEKPIIVNEKIKEIEAQNGTLIAMITDGEETILSATLTINNIDNIGPTFETIVNENIVTITNVNDTGIGLHESAYSCDGTWQKSNICKFKTIGSHTVNVRDALENEGSIEITNGIPAKQYVGVKAIVFYNPVTDKSCNKEESISVTGTKDVCMRWYVYEETDDSYIMILDHNISNSVKWNSNGDSSDNSEIINTLNQHTSNWAKDLNVRLISADEVAKIVDPTNSMGFNSKTSGNDKWFSFQDLSQTIDSTNECATNNNCKYAWLYDRTYTYCTTYGCLNDNEDAAWGYWTSSAVYGDAKGAWHVGGNGGFGGADITKGQGLRPVITLSKTKFN